MLFYKAIGSGIGIGVGYAANQLGNYGVQFISEHYDKIPFEAAKNTAFVAATGIGFFTSRDYWKTKRRAHMAGFE